MSKTVSIPDEVHTLIVEKQLEISKKYRITVKISDLIAVIVKNNIDKAGEYLGLRTEERITTNDGQIATNDGRTVTNREDITI